MQENFDIPYFLIVGAMKSGTTSLQQYLIKHPAIAIPNYEIHYFDKEENYIKGSDWYKQQFPVTQNTQITGEKTPAYSLHAKVPQRIYDLNPQTKLIWILRNPVARTYSNYLHAVKKGAEKNTFKQALEEEDKRKDANYILDYKKRSMYYEQVKHFSEIFPLRKMHFILFEHFIKNPQKELNILCDFLGIEKIAFDKIIKTHKSYWPFSIYLQFYSRKIFRNSHIYKGITRLNRFFSFQKPDMNNETEQVLYQYFKEENRQLSDLIDKDLSLWNSNSSST